MKTIPAVFLGAALWVQPLPAIAGDGTPGALAGEIRALLDAGRYREADAASRILVERAERAFGPDALETARALDLSLESAREMGRVLQPESAEIGERAIRIKEALLGASHPEVADSLVSLAKLLNEAGKWLAAAELAGRGRVIRETVLGNEHPDVAEALSVIAVAHYRLNEYPEARRHFERALSMFEKNYGPEHRRVAGTLAGLAGVCMREGEPERARDLYLRAVSILERLLGPDHPQVANALNGLSQVLFWELGELHEARRIQERVIAVREKILPEDHHRLFWIRDEYALTLWQMGEHAAARELLERVVADGEKIFGIDDRRTANVSNHLANLYLDLGDYPRSRALQQRVLDVRIRTRGRYHNDVAASHNNLALVLTALGEYPEAERHARRAILVWEKVDGPDSLDLPDGLNTLGDLRRRQGDSAGAEPLYERAVAIWEKAPISEPLRMAYSLQNLAETLAELRDSGAARPPMHRALAIFERVLGSEHPDSARALIALAGMQWQAGDSAGALEHSLSAEAAARRHFRATARGLAEREALRLEEIRSSGLDLALSILARPGASGAPSSAIARAFEEVVRSRGMVLDEMAARHRAAVEHEEAETASLSRALEAVRTRLSRLAVEGARPGREQEYSARLHSLREEKERAERALADRSAAFSRELEDQRAGLAGIAAALPPETALVSILQYRQRNSPVETERKTEGIPSYVAFVLAPGHRSPVLTSLGPARPLEALIARWKEEASASRHGRILAPEATEARFREAGEAVRQALWDPLQKHVGQAKYVFLVPDGALHLLNLATLPAEDGRYLIETGPIIHYLTAERDLLRRREPSRPGAGMLVLGAPDFDAPPQPAGAVLAAGVPPRLQAARYRSRRAACADFRSLRFQPLPESLREAEEVEALWKRAEVADAARDSGVLKLTGARAREDDFKRQVTGHRIVHLATHGFFAGDRCASTLEGTLVSAPSELLADSPLLLTGLALAGANRREAVGVDAEDGILTAEEIASLDLTGVEWAVLSACETGAGPVQNGEGVLGLRRAFEMAGAGTLIMSLWSVEDTAAREWMGGLYEGRFRGLSTAEAVREASLKMIRARRQSGRSTHPASWGAFVAAGDWR